MNITINIYGDIKVEIEDGPCASCENYDDYEDEYDELCDECKSHAEDAEASDETDDCIIGRLKADFSNIDDLMESVPPDVLLAVAVKLGMSLVELQCEELEADSHG